MTLIRSVIDDLRWNDEARLICPLAFCAIPTHAIMVDICTSPMTCTKTLWPTSERRYSHDYSG